jgi:hypothetical protein
MIIQIQQYFSWTEFNKNFTYLSIIGYSHIGLHREQQLAETSALQDKDPSESTSILLHETSPINETSLSHETSPKRDESPSLFIQQSTSCQGYVTVSSVKSSPEHSASSPPPPQPPPVTLSYPTATSSYPTATTSPQSTTLLFIASAQASLSPGKVIQH